MMVNKKTRLSMYFINIAALVFTLLVCIPFSKSHVSEVEILIKYIIVPIVILGFFIANVIMRHKANAPTVKFLTVFTYAPIFFYILAAGVSTLSILFRTTASYENFTNWAINCTFVVMIVVGVAVFSHLFYRAVLVFSFKENMFIDIALVLAVAVEVIYFRSLTMKAVGTNFEINSGWFVFAVIFFSALVSILHGLLLTGVKDSTETYKYVSKKETLEKWNAIREEIYAQAEVDVLYNMHYYTKERLGIEEDDEEVDIEVELAAEVEPEVEPEPIVEIVKEIIQKTDPEELAKLEAEKERIIFEKARLEGEKEELAARREEIATEKAMLEKQLAGLVIPVVSPVRERAPRTPKEPPVLKPSFEEILNYVNAIPNITVNANGSNTMYRCLVGKKPFLLLQKTSSDYRITFLIDHEKVLNYIAMPGFSKATSPKGENWFKVVNKNELAEDMLFGFIDDSHKMLTVLEERAAALKEQEKREKAEARAKERLDAKLAKMTDEEKSVYYAKEAARKERERLAQEEASLTDEEREARRLEKEQQLAAEKAAKAEAREKEREAARLAKEKERARLAKEREKQKEKERLAKEKEKEKERLAKEKEKQKEKERLAKEKEKEKERLAKEKEKQKEKERLVKEKEKEKARLAKEKQKQKEKEQLTKEKAKAAPKKAA